MNKRVVIGSANPVKTAAVKLGFEQVFPGITFEYISVAAPSNISDQPLSEAETLQGALNRAENAIVLSPNADYYVGLEGGVEEKDKELHELAWIVVRDANGKIGKGKTATFLLPKRFHELVIGEGKEVGEVTDIVFSQTNSKQNMGAIGLLTNGVIDRAELYRHAVVSALIPFSQQHLY